MPPLPDSVSERQGRPAPTQSRSCRPCLSDGRDGLTTNATSCARGPHQWHLRCGGTARCVPGADLASRAFGDVGYRPDRSGSCCFRPRPPDNALHHPFKFGLEGTASRRGEGGGGGCIIKGAVGEWKAPVLDVGALPLRSRHLGGGGGGCASPHSNSPDPNVLRVSCRGGWREGASRAGPPKGAARVAPTKIMSPSMRSIVLFAVVPPKVAVRPKVAPNPLNDPLDAPVRPDEGDAVARRPPPPPPGNKGLRSSPLARALGHGHAGRAIRPLPGAPLRGEEGWSQALSPLPTTRPPSHPPHSSL